jgi:NADH pyrophosphatase NudC (nudix superfamily)
MSISLSDSQFQALRAAFEQCIRRELSEEIQVGVKEIGPALFVYTGKTENSRPKMSIAVRVSIDDAVVTPTDDDLVEARYVSREEFLELPFSESERAVLAYVDKIWI